MIKTIITQNGDIINLSSLFAIYIDTSHNIEADKDTYELSAIGAWGQTFTIGVYPDETSAINAKSEIIRWLQNEAYSTFDLTAA